MPLEVLRYPVTPTGLHYLLTHYDTPAVDPATLELSLRGRPRAGVRAQPHARGGASRLRAARLRDERRAAPSPARFPAPPRRPGLVRDDPREVADPDHGRRRADYGLPAGGGVPLAPGR